jgi:hypothetical protein
MIVRVLYRNELKRKRDWYEGKKNRCFTSNVNLSYE